MLNRLIRIKLDQMRDTVARQIATAAFQFETTTYRARLYRSIVLGITLVEAALITFLSIPFYRGVTTHPVRKS